MQTYSSELQRIIGDEYRRGNRSKMHMKNRNLPFRRILPTMRLGSELLLFTRATDDFSESKSDASNRINLKLRWI